MVDKPNTFWVLGQNVIKVEFEFDRKLQFFFFDFLLFFLDEFFFEIVSTARMAIDKRVRNFD